MFTSRFTCRVGLALASAGLVASVAAAALDRTAVERTSDRRLRDGELSPAAAQQIQHDQAVQLQHALAQQHVKGLINNAFDLDPYMTLIDNAADMGAVADDVIAEVAGRVSDPAAAFKVSGVLHEYATWLLNVLPNPEVPSTDPGMANVGGPHALSVGNDAQFGGQVGSNNRPDLGGTCLSCPSSNFGPFTPTAAAQLHSSSLSTSSDCNRYLFNVTSGTQYEFTTCAPGSATFDTEIEGDNNSGCAVLAQNDDYCGLQSRIAVTPAFTGQMNVKVYPFSSPGSYTLSYRIVAPCLTCASPQPGSFTPSQVTCQTISGTAVACQDNYYVMNLIAGHTYEFSTNSGGTCPPYATTSLCTGSATFDSEIAVFNPSCVQVALDDDCSGLQSRLNYTAAVTGAHRVRVFGFGGATGTFVLSYRDIPPIPVISSVSPTAGATGAGAATCGTTQTYTVTFTGQTPVTLTWTITAPAGGSAAPTSGSTVVASGTVGNFSSALTRLRCGASGNYVVRVTASNVAGTSAPFTINYTLADNTPPVFTTFPANLAIDCAAPIPPPGAVAIRDNCDTAPTFTGPTQTTSNRICPGTYTITRTWTARDCNGNTNAKSQTILVQDTHAPVIIPATAALACIWPPDHKMVHFNVSDIAVNATDDCSPPIRFTLVGVSSSQCDDAPCAAHPGENGDGSTTGDVLVDADGQGFTLRAERAGTDPDGRHYVLMFTATDACGNTSAPTAAGSVDVPHDMSVKQTLAQPCVSAH